MSRLARPALLTAALIVAVVPVASHADGDGAGGLHGPLAQTTRTALASPYVFTPEAQLVSEPEWQKNFKQGLDRAKLVGYPWFFFSVPWTYIQSPVTGAIDLSGLDTIVIAAHDDGIQLVMDLQTCNFSEPMPPTITGGGYRTNSNKRGQPSCAPTNIDAALPAWTAIAARYAPDSAWARNDQHWTDHYGVLHYEVENEPDSLTWTTGNYSAVPKDYALFVHDFKLALNNIDDRIQLLATALSQNAPAADWLRNVLSVDPSTMANASDDYRAAVAGGAPIVGAGPYIGAYSYHEDFANSGTSVLVDRPKELHDLITGFANQAGYPTTDSPMLWCTECGSGYVSGKDATAQLNWSYGEAQYMLETIGDGSQQGVAHIATDFSTNNMDDDATFTAEPDFAMAKAFVAHFPTNTGWSNTSAAVTTDANPTFEYTWTNPDSHLRSMALFARDLPSNTGANTPTVIAGPTTQPGPDYTVNVPVNTDNVTVIVGWQEQPAQVHTDASGNRFVTVTLHAAQPSPVVMVIENPAS